MPEYEKKQKEQNKDLEVILQEHEGQAVLLSETNTKTQPDDQGKTLLEEIDTILVSIIQNIKKQYRYIFVPILKQSYRYQISAKLDGISTFHEDFQLFYYKQKNTILLYQKISIQLVISSLNYFQNALLRKPYFYGSIVIN